MATNHQTPRCQAQVLLCPANASPLLNVPWPSDRCQHMHIWQHHIPKSVIKLDANTHFLLVDPQTTPTTVTSKIDPLAALNPLFFHQHIVQQLVTNGQGAHNTQPLRQLREFAQHQQPHRQHSQLQQQQQQLSANNVDKTTSLLQQQQQQALAAVSTERKELTIIGVVAIEYRNEYKVLLSQLAVILQLLYARDTAELRVGMSTFYPQTLCMLDFVPASEEQIVQQFHQNRRCDDDVRKAMTLLSKMLAEKRVFGTKLMAQTTVAGPNHSTYKNLPEEGIHYIAFCCRYNSKLASHIVVRRRNFPPSINNQKAYSRRKNVALVQLAGFRLETRSWENRSPLLVISKVVANAKMLPKLPKHVCRSVMLHRIPNEDEFWEVFRDVTRKLAARCRRVRHSKKTRCEGREAHRITDCVGECGSVSTDSLRITFYTLGSRERKSNVSHRCDGCLSSRGNTSLSSKIDEKGSEDRRNKHCPFILC
uniref:Uncharacterized protein n=1 Tax=Parascaris equorum TaxID=6256 RepID=A0A914RS56_PAREQ